MVFYIYIVGGFHAQMRFLRCIGYLTAGYQDWLELIYAPKTVKYILADKAVTRATSNDLRIYAVLNAVLNAILEVPILHYENLANGGEVILCTRA